MAKRVAVIGAAGFIGSHVMEELAAQNIAAEGFDFNVDGKYAVKFVDVARDKHDVLRAVGNDAPSAIISLAGVLGTHELFDGAERAISVNVLGQYNIAWVAQALDVPVVMIEQPHVWTNVYETTRGAGIRIARGLAEHRGLQLATVTAFNAFGERQDYGIGHPQKIVPTFSVYAHNGQLAPIFGSGNQVVNLVHAEDIAKVMIAAIDHARPGKATPNFFGAAVNGNMTTNEVYKMVYSHVGTDWPLPADPHVPMRDGELDDEVGAPAPTGLLRRQEDLLGFTPRLDQAKFRKAVDYYKGYKI